MTRLFQFLRELFTSGFQFSYRDRQTFHADFEPRLKAQSFACHTCRQAFPSFAALRAHACRPSVQG